METLLRQLGTVADHVWPPTRRTYINELIATSGSLVDASRRIVAESRVIAAAARHTMAACQQDSLSRAARPR